MCMGCGQNFKRMDHYDAHVAKCSVVLTRTLGEGENECEDMVHYEDKGIDSLEICFEDADAEYENEDLEIVKTVVYEGAGYSAQVMEGSEIDGSCSMEKTVDSKSVY